MISGDMPYKGDTPVQLMYAHLNQPVPDICTARPDAPPAVQRVLEQAMAKATADRYPRAGDLAAALRRAAEYPEETIQAAPVMEAQPTVEARRGASTAQGPATPGPLVQPVALPGQPSASIPLPEMGVSEAPERIPAWRRNWRMIVAVVTALLLYRVALGLILFALGISP
jgi:serine/threonine-protein kinase